MRTAIADLGHEAPLETSGEASAATAAQTRALDLVGDPIAALIQKFLRTNPRATRTSAFETPIVLAVEVGKNAVFISEH
jgi:hypothetical protein